MSLAVPPGLETATQVSLPAETRVFKAGDTCEQFFFLLEGTIRVDLLTRSGKPVTLYRFSGGESCILTTSCLLSGEDYSAEAMVESAALALALPHSAFRNLLNSSENFRELVFSSFALRLSEMMAKVEEVTSVSVDERLALRLLQLCDAEQPVKITHDQLAADLGTAREVISRKLAAWEKSGWIERGRGLVLVRDPSQLEQIISDD